MPLCAEHRTLVHSCKSHTPVLQDELPASMDYCETCGEVHKKSPASPGWTQPVSGTDVWQAIDMLKVFFREQHAYTLAYYGVTFGSEAFTLSQKGINIGKEPINIGSFSKRVGHAQRIEPLLEIAMLKGGEQTLIRIGAGEVNWSRSNAQLIKAIHLQAMQLSATTSATTSMQINAAVVKLKKEMIAGIIGRGEGPRELTKRIAKIFNHGELWRAKQIARTEYSMALHDGQVLAGAASEVVKGFRPLLSPDACILCLNMASAYPFVKMKSALRGIGKYNKPNARRGGRNLPTYHPNCECTMVEVLVGERKPSTPSIIG